MWRVLMWLNLYGHEAVRHKLEIGLKTQKYIFYLFLSLCWDRVKGGCHLQDSSISYGISRVIISHVICYKFIPLIGWNYSIQTWEQIVKRNSFWKIIFPPMRALKFITVHVILKLLYNQIYKLKTTFIWHSDHTLRDHKSKIIKHLKYFGSKCISTE